MLDVYKDNDHRINNIALYGSHKDIRKALINIESNILETTKWIKQHTERNQRNLAFHNFLFASVTYIDLLLSQKDAPTQLLAFCARNLYELHLQCRRIQNNEACLKQWIAEAVTDNIEIMEACLKLDTENHAEQRQIFSAAIKRNEAILKQYDLTRQNAHPVRDIANDLSKKNEHDTLYKICSKFLHPTSYFVNSSAEEIQNPQIKNIFIIHTQLYAWDIIDNVRKSVNFTGNSQGEV